MFSNQDQYLKYIVMTSEDSSDELVLELQNVAEIDSASSSTRSRRLYLCMMCRVAAIYTSKLILVDYSFHYPFTFSFYTFIAILVAHISEVCYNYFHESLRGELDNTTSYECCQAGIITRGDWLAMLPASVIASLSLLMLLQSILHMPSFSSLIMILPAAYAYKNLALYTINWIYGTKGFFPWSTFAIMSASGISLYNENRLTVLGLIWGCCGVMSLGISQACYVLGLQKLPSTSQAQKAFRCYTVTSAVIGISLSGSLAYALEETPPTSVLGFKLIILMALSIMTSSGAWLTSAANSWSNSTVEMQHNQPILVVQDADCVASAVSNVLLLLAAILSFPGFYVDWIQLIAFFTSISLVIGLDRIIQCFSSRINYARDSVGNKQLTPRCIKVILVATIGAISFLLALTASASIDTLPRGPTAILDLSYQPKSRFDIVVSMYKEDPESVKRMIDRFQATALLHSLDFEGRKARVIVYTKNPATDLDILRNATGADLVIQLENSGREGGTYLQHIVTRWNSLAEQTMFVQAHAHNMQELIPRIDNYLVHNTGMLSLGFSGIACPCGQCSDRWGWEDQTHNIPRMYEQIYGEPCLDLQPILLSYKGQFIVSARRIRGVQRELYTQLRRSITGEDDDLRHDVTDAADADQHGHMNRSSSRSYLFGYTMERMWGLIMQCAIDERMAASCPSLLSGSGWGGNPQDCQCLDIISQ